MIAISIKRVNVWRESEPTVNWNYIGSFMRDDTCSDIYIG